jgi:hypothetical protein
MFPFPLLEEIQMPKLGERVNVKEAIQGPPPVVLAVQPNAYFVIDKPEELEQWERDVKQFLGVDKLARPAAGTESCSGGCSDDCDM